MRSKIVIISLIFILAIVGISCVSAEDIDDVSNISAVDDADISIDDSIDDDCLRANIGNQDPGVNSYITVNSWTALDGALNGTSGYDTVGIGSSMAPEKQIVINHDVTIVGSANTYIGGSDSNHMASYNYIPFMVSQDGLSITLKNIRFQNCGNNIFIQFSGNGNYLIENCTFTNMYASGDHQSVVYLNNGHGNITSCTFENCTNLKTVELPLSTSNYAIRQYCFKNTALTGINIPESVTSVDKEAFAGTNLSENGLTTDKGESYGIAFFGKTTTVDDTAFGDVTPIVAGYDNSNADTYAFNHNFKFVSLGNWNPYSFDSPDLPGNTSSTSNNNTGNTSSASTGTSSEKSTTSTSSRTDGSTSTS